LQVVMNDPFSDSRDAARGGPDGHPERGTPIVTYQERGVKYCGEKPASRLGVASLILAIVALGLARFPLFGPVAVMGLGVIGGALGIVGLIVALWGLRSSVGFPLAGIVTCGHAFVIGLVLTLGSTRPENSFGMTGGTQNPGPVVREAEAESRSLASAAGINFKPLQWRGVRAQLLRPLWPTRSQAPDR
jgi:hypothetical protein